MSKVQHTLIYFEHLDHKFTEEWKYPYTKTICALKKADDTLRYTKLNYHKPVRLIL